MKKAWREQRELVALRDDQIAMLERRLAKYTGEKVYPFKEGDLYYVFNQLDGTWIESVWDHESERIHDARACPTTHTRCTSRSIRRTCSTNSNPKMTDEYLDRKWAEIEESMRRFEATASPHDKMMLDCMVRDWEAKMKLKLQQHETIQSSLPPRSW